MPITWDHYVDLAPVLERAYPEADLSRLALPDLARLVTALPEFVGAPTPPRPHSLDLILAAWLQLRQDEAHNEPCEIIQ